LLSLNKLLKLSKLALVELLCLNEDRLVVYKLIILPVLLEYHMRASASHPQLLGLILLLLQLSLLTSPILRITVSRAQIVPADLDYARSVLGVAYALRLLFIFQSSAGKMPEIVIRQDYCCRLR
jgi:hypothetical protein